MLPNLYEILEKTSRNQDQQLGKTVSPLLVVTQVLKLKLFT